jgi:8-oxo-dGTP pyrophosphatase MutT (NUDIX family)
LQAIVIGRKGAYVVLTKNSRQTNDATGRPFAMMLQPRPSEVREKDRFMAPRATQVAALCWRKTDAGGREVLLVTSSTGRWILPKGWPMDGKRDCDAALIEAQEEAGVRRGKVDRKSVGEFISAKFTADGDDMPCRTRVFAVKVQDIGDDFPEADRRARRWLSPADAADLVTEDGLRDILRQF